MPPSVQKLADTIGILTSYVDESNHKHEIDENTIRLLAEKLGATTSTKLMKTPLGCWPKN